MILDIVKKVIEADPKSVNDFKNGKEKSVDGIIRQMYEGTEREL